MNLPLHLFNNQCNTRRTATTPAKEWKEAPKEVYEAWPRAKQLEYCRDRDLYFMALAETWQDYEFFAERADGYNEDLIVAVLKERKLVVDGEVVSAG